MNSWELPQSLTVGGRERRIHADFRDILEILRWLDDAREPEYLRWHVALALFYEDGIEAEHRQEAMEQLSAFLTCGQQERPGPKLLDWDQDARIIVADVNRAAGTEIRALPFVHWWTFLSWFHAVGEGQLSALVALRGKLRRGQKLEKWEQEYYRAHKAQVDLKRPETAEEAAEKRRLLAMLN